MDADLCAWGPQLQNSSFRDVLALNDMFGGTECDSLESPDLTAAIPGPFCSQCSSAHANDATVAVALFLSVLVWLF